MTAEAAKAEIERAQKHVHEAHEIAVSLDAATYIDGDQAFAVCDGIRSDLNATGIHLNQLRDLIQG